MTESVGLLRPCSDYSVYRTVSTLVYIYSEEPSRLMSGMSSSNSSSSSSSYSSSNSSSFTHSNASPSYAASLALYESHPASNASSASFSGSDSAANSASIYYPTTTTTTTTYTRSASGTTWRGGEGLADSSSTSSLSSSIPSLDANALLLERRAQRAKAFKLDGIPVMTPERLKGTFTNPRRFRRKRGHAGLEHDCGCAAESDRE